jgi:hypothetical protein
VNVALQPDDLTRLIKLAGMLASAHAGERAAAALKCTELLAAHGMSWADALQPPPVTQIVQVVQAPPGPRTWRVVADELLINHYGALHQPNEVAFLSGLLQRGFAPSVKQAAWLGKICRRTGVPLWEGEAAGPIPTTPGATMWGTP